MKSPLLLGGRGDFGCGLFKRILARTAYGSILLPSTLRNAANHFG
jgi:hypothetical protein